MPTMMATLASVITRNVGPTTNAQFAAQFSTLVTPASFVFLIWPFIAAVQALTLTASILRPSFRDGGPQSSLEALNTLGAGEPLSQAELSSLALANAAATAWLFVSSNSPAGALPLASALVIPLVPLCAGFPLRSASPPPRPYKFVFQVFAGFTTIASCLAIAVELQHGGRLPFFTGRPEVCGGVFLALVGAIVRLPGQSWPRRAVTSLALSGVVARRLTAGVAAASLVRSPTFVAAVALCAWSAVKLVVGDGQK